MPDRRDDALSWDGDDDPTLDAGRAASDAPHDEEAPAAAVLPEGYQAVGRGSEGVRNDVKSERRGDAPAAPQDSATTDADTHAPLGNVALIALGVIGGIYLLYSIGWIIGGLRVSAVAGFLVSPTGAAPVTWASGNLVGVWLAAAAPALWFVTVIVLTRAARAWVRWVWLAAGVVLLVPWPLLMGGMGA